MTLSLTLGMSVGFRRTLWMMAGELLGVALVAIAALAGIAAILLQWPLLFKVFKIAGGAYLFYVGIRLWRSSEVTEFATLTSAKQTSRSRLALQGFITAVSNPKGWAFMISLLPPFINAKTPVFPQVAVMLAVLLAIELFSLLLYALGGSRLRVLLKNQGGARLLNRIAGSLMLLVGLWLALD